jgi:hypothetical protein
MTVSARLVNRNVSVPLLIVEEITCINLCRLVRYDVAHDEVDEDSQSRLLILIDLIAIAFLDIVLDVSSISNVPVLSVVDLEEGLEHHSCVCVEIKKLHLIELESFEPVLQSVENPVWRLAGHLIIEAIALGSLALLCPCMLEADNMRDETVR